MSSQPRQPAGTPIGGQFAPVHRLEASNVELTEVREPSIRTLTEGTREEICTLPVDTATMAMGVRWPDEPPTEVFDLLRSGIDGIVSCSTFGADGRYPAYLLRDDQGVKGLEVVFYIPSVEAESDRRLDEAGVVRPDLDAGNEEQNRYWREVQSSYSEVWDEIGASVHPADDCEPTVLAELDVVDRVFLGDPCYAGHSEMVEMPSGRYVAVVWRRDGDTCRLGLYRKYGDEAEREVCDECGVELDPDAELVVDQHAISCSLHPENVVEADSSADQPLIASSYRSLREAMDAESNTWTWTSLAAELGKERASELFEQLEGSLGKALTLTATGEARIGIAELPGG